MHAISNYHGNRPTHPQTQTIRADYNTLRRKLARSVIKATREAFMPLSSHYQLTVTNKMSILPTITDLRAGVVVASDIVSLYVSAL